MWMIKTVIVALILSCTLFSGQATGIVITPSNVLLPSGPGDLFSFDLIVEELTSSFDAKGFQSTVELGGPGILTFDEIACENVSSDIDYWLVGNSAGANARDLGSNVYEFGDGPNQGNGPLGDKDSIVARYVFSWDGTDGLYTFTFDFADLNKNYVLGLPPDYPSYPLQLPEGQWYSDPIVSATDNSFTVSIPEPAALMLFGLGSLTLLRKRKA